MGSGIVRGDRLYRVIFWESESTTQRSEDQLLLVYDTTTDKLISTVKETRCRALGARAYAAEDGTLYFSNWVWAITDTLLYGPPAHCILRINPGEEVFDADWSLAYSDVAEGREGAAFTYLKGAQGWISIFHNEDIEHNADTDPYEYATSANWELWNIDLDTRHTSPVAGVPRNGGGYTSLTLSGRNFVMVANQELTRTQLYEIDGNNAKAGLVIPGWSYNVKQLR